MTDAPKKMQGVIGLLKATINIYKNNFRFYLGYAAWLLVPGVIVLLLSTVVGGETINIIDSIFNSLVYIALAMWLTIIFTKATAEFAQNKKVQNRKLNQESWSLIIPVFLVSIFIGLITLGGYILLIVPGVIFSVWFAFSVTIFILEKSGIAESLGLSKTLVAGRFWPTLWRVLAGGVVVGVSYIILIMLFVGLYSAISGVDLGLLTAATPVYAQNAISRIIEVFIVPIAVVYQIMLYLELKKTR
ncbi:MAG: hypothetical protein ABIA47_00030 [bacterium]